MRHSVGITLSAVAAFVGSAFCILLGALVVMTGLLARSSNKPDVLQNIAYVQVIVAFFFLGLGGWGIASGVGLIKARQWARISMLAFGSLLVFFCVPPAIMIAFISFPVPKDPNLPSNFISTMRISMVSFYGALAALGAFWLYFFNRRSVKAQFSSRSAIVSGPEGIPGAVTVRPGIAARRARPISITVIGWLLLVSAPLGGLGLLYTHAMFPSIPIPLCMFGFFIFGKVAALILVTWVLAQAVLAVGVLRLQNWGRIGTIGLQTFGLVNLMMFAAIPASRARFQQIMEAMTASMNARMPQPVPFTLPVWTTMVATVPVFCAVLWFLITQRQAFAPLDRNVMEGIQGSPTPPQTK